MNNLVPLDRHNFALFCTFIEHYYLIGFESPLHDVLVGIYQQSALDGSADEDHISKSEQVLGFGISWIKGLLDNPGIWVSDMVYSDRDPTSTG